MLRQNSELRPHRIWNWTLPAWYVTLEDGTRFHTCPNAGACTRFCYALNGTYRFPNVRAAHRANLERVLADSGQWVEDMVTELSKKKYRPIGIPRDIPLDPEQLDPWVLGWVKAGGAAVRIHDAGDFFAAWYLLAWVEVSRRVPDVLFYAYSKEVSMVLTHRDSFPVNLRVLFSTGGLEDHLIDPDVHRHADVFPSEFAIEEAGYESQDASDLLAVLLPTTRIGIPANNIPAFNKRLAGRRFSEAVPVHLRMGATKPAPGGAGLSG